MARTGKCITLVRGRVARVTRLDGCGRPVYGEYNHATTEGVITVNATANSTDTEEINVTNFAGRRCVYEPSIPELNGYTFDLTFCNVDPELFEIITGQTLVLNEDGNPVGLEIDTVVKLSEVGFALEVFAGAVGADACEDENAEGVFGYLLAARLQGGILGDFTVENGAVNFTVSGAASRDGNQWGSGPYAVEMVAGVAAPLFQPVSKTAALRLMETTVTPPEGVCGARPLLNPTLPAFTTIAATEGDTALTAEFATTPAATGPTWWEFGDGEWDYVVAPGATDHVYAAAGTYTAKASQNGVNWTSTTVVVPFA